MRCRRKSTHSSRAAVFAEWRSAAGSRSVRGSCPAGRRAPAAAVALTRTRESACDPTTAVTTWRAHFEGISNAPPARPMVHVNAWRSTRWQTYEIWLLRGRGGQPGKPDQSASAFGGEGEWVTLPPPTPSATHCISSAERFVSELRPIGLSENRPSNGQPRRYRIECKRFYCHPRHSSWSAFSQPPSTASASICVYLYTWIQLIFLFQFSTHLKKTWHSNTDTRYNDAFYIIIYCNIL